MDFETLISGWEFLEAPKVDETGNLYFTDVTVGGLHRRSPDGRIESFLAGRTWIGGIALNQDGGVVCSGKGGLILFDVKTGASRSLLSTFNGQPIGAVNDFYPDDNGGVIAGLLDADAIGAGRAPEGRPLIRLAPTGDVTTLWDGIKVSNGIGFSPDRKRLYHSESYEALWVYDVEPDGSLHNRRVFAPIKDADGLSVDSQGGIWVARFASSAVVRYWPDGRIDRHCVLPVKEVQSVTFGGPDLRDLYVVTGSSFENPNNLTVKTGCVFRARCDIAGQPVPKTRF